MVRGGKAERRGEMVCRAGPNQNGRNKVSVEEGTGGGREVECGQV